ncbi:enoyl-CoA hydratase-related protein [Flavisphingomonas formosensis]|uniref:enoyl-CoA hydratase-related protein n=1 Tax=Flavisphingomonas formosensis TaxID=861534 RepID=UPI0012F81C90|nr:enoyl-CoA hydratase-related protein [Sphingomonas formosensis]
MTEGIALTKTGRVIEIHIDRAHKKNSLTADMYRAMTEALADASRREEIDVVLVAGKGEIFCAGNDLQDFLAGPEGGAAAFAFVGALASFDKPIVAAVQGMAVGIGTTMLFHCDLVYAAPGTRLLMPFVSLGLPPEAGSSLFAPAVLGYAKAAALLMLGEPLDVEDAERAGLITSIVPADDLLAHARAKAAALAAQPATALAVTRRLMKPDPAVLAARIEQESRLFRELMQSADAKEAFTAFVEKRKPMFNKGRK